MNIEETVDFHLRSTLFRMMRMYNLIAAENGITQAIGYVLILIKEEGIPATKIAPVMGMGTSSLTRLLKNMEDDGLIFRVSDKNDKRVVKIFLTEKGKKLRETAKGVVINFNQKLSKQITPKEMEAFTKVSGIIRNQVQTEIEEFQKNNPKH